MRLTNTMRDSICRALISKKFDKTEEAMARQEHEVALMVYRIAFGDETIKKMRSLPAGWLPTINRMLVRTASGSTDALNVKEELLVPYEKNRGYTSPMLLDSKVCESKTEKAVADHLKDKSQLKQDKVKLTQEVRAALSSFNTDNQVIDKWPEIKEQVIRVCGTGTKCTTLAPRLEDLNKKLGL